MVGCLGRLLLSVQTIRDLTATSRDENRQLAVSGGGICNIGPAAGYFSGCQETVNPQFRASSKPKPIAQGMLALFEPQKIQDWLRSLQPAPLIYYAGAACSLHWIDSLSFNGFSLADCNPVTTYRGCDGCEYKVRWAAPCAPYERILCQTSVCERRDCGRAILRMLWCGGGAATAALVEIDANIVAKIGFQFVKQLQSSLISLRPCASGFWDLLPWSRIKVSSWFPWWTVQVFLELRSRIKNLQRRQRVPGNTRRLSFLHVSLNVKMVSAHSRM